MLTPARLIVFDCDGTLADVQFVAIEAMRHTLRAFNLPCPSRHELIKVGNLCAPDAVAWFTPSAGLEVWHAMTATYCEWLRVLQLQAGAQDAMFDGAARLLSSLGYRDGMFLGMATGKSRNGAYRFLACHGLESLFSTVQTADDAPSKPHPAMLLKAMDDVGVVPQQTVMVGDLPADMEMALAAGAMPIGVSWGYASVNELKRAGARAVAESFADLGRLLLAASQGLGTAPNSAAVA